MKSLKAIIGSRASTQINLSGIVMRESRMRDAFRYTYDQRKRLLELLRERDPVKRGLQVLQRCLRAFYPFVRQTGRSLHCGVGIMVMVRR